jgi:hypothetical protein
VLYNSLVMPTYRGVRCKTKDCGNLIPLATLVISDRGIEIPFMDKPMMIKCGRCEQTHEYQNLDLIQFEPTPSPH